MNSNVLAQNATQLAVSNGTCEWDQIMFDEAAKRAGERTSKGTTRERRLINRNKLISAVCADFRSHFPAIYGKTDRLPTHVFNMVDKAVDGYINESLSLVNANNALSVRRAFYHDGRNMQVTERVIATGENLLSLKEQKFGVLLFISAAEKRLTDLQKKPTPDYDREKEVKQQIMKLKLTEQFILGEIASQEKATATPPAAQA